jgi:hypothetical protein
VQDIKDRYQELDQLMNSLNGVLAAKTVTEDDTITDIHILSDSSKSPKQLVRDVQSAVMAKLGTSIDYKLISIAQVDRNLVVPAEGIPLPEMRLKILRISTSLEGSNVETSVVLNLNGQTFQGSSRCLVAGRNAALASANACISALRKYLGDDCQLNLLDLQHQTLAGQPCLTAALSLSMSDKEGVFYGIAPVQSPDLEVQAAAMAVLSSINRPLSRNNRS